MDPRVFFEFFQMMMLAVAQNGIARLYPAQVAGHGSRNVTASNLAAHAPIEARQGVVNSRVNLKKGGRLFETIARPCRREVRNWNDWKSWCIPW